MLNEIEKMLGKKVRWATQKEVLENVNMESESVTFKGGFEFSIDTVEQLESSDEEIYYITKNGEFIDYVIAIN